MPDLITPRGGAVNVDLGPIVNQTAATTGVTSPDRTNTAAKGVKVVVNITTLTGTAPTLTVQIRGKDQTSGQYYTILASAALSATGVTVLTVYPGLTASANVTANDVLPRTWDINVVGGGTITNATYTVGANLLV